MRGDIRSNGELPAALSWDDPDTDKQPASLTGAGISSLKQHDHELPGLQFGLQFTAVRPSSPEYAHEV